MGKVKKQKRHGPGGLGKPPGMKLADMMALKRQAEAAVVADAKDIRSKVLGDRQAQRMEWVDNVVLAEHFGFTAEQLQELDKRRADELALYARRRQEIDQDYADEKLRREASAYCNRALEYIHKELPVNQDLTPEGLAVLREAEGRIY